MFSTVAKLRVRWCAFRRAQGGNVALIFALALFPVMLMVGAGVDYSRAARLRTLLQDTLDATGLMLARTPSIATYNAAQLQTLGTTYFNAQFTPSDAYNSTVTATFDASTMTINLTGATTMNTQFMQLAGIQQMNIGTTSSVTWGLTRLRVALVLDNTGSMNDSGKIGALKTASHQLLTQLQNIQRAGGDVQVSIVPFTTDVNISSYANGSTAWIDWSQWSPVGSIEMGLTCGSGSGNNGNGWGWGWGGGGVTCGGSDHSAWNGCVMDRTQPYDAQNTAPTSSSAYFPADQSAWCPAAMLALTNDWTALNNKIDAMVANGDTNQTIGLAWGWQSLTQGSPLNAPALQPYTQQAIVLLTDGLNTQNRWSTAQSQIDPRTAAACTNVKSAGIMIFTVLVMSGDSQILKDCASDPSMYFALTAANQMVDTFSQIGTKLSQLRISR